MSDQYQSTNKLSENTYPERSHLLLEGIIDIAPSEYTLIGGMYTKVKGVDFTRLIKLGARNKGFGPQSLDIQVRKTKLISGGGQIDDYYYTLPFTEYSSFSPVTITERAIAYQHNVYITADQIYAAFIEITHQLSVLPGRTQSFSYKIYSTLYEYTDTLF